MCIRDRAWVVCKILAKELGLGHPDGFVFNMSVGYDLEGIKSEKVNTFIDDMIEAKAVSYTHLAVFCETGVTEWITV